MALQPISIGEDGKRKGFGGADGDNDVLFQFDDLVWAISRPISGGEKYSLSRQRYDVLVQCVNFARKRASETRKYLDSIRGDVSSKTLVKDDGSLTGAGLLAEHFNLTKNMTHLDDDIVGGTWRLDRSAKMKTCSGADLKMLFNKVSSVAELTSQGLNDRTLLRGMNLKKSSSSEALGLVRGRWEPTKRAPERGVDAPARENTIKTKTGLFSSKEVFRKMAPLKDDDVFANQEAQLGGSIHVDYGRIPSPSDLLEQQRNAPPMPWIIVHEATHKFARTRDVNGGRCYSVAECRDIHWEQAVRNATHHERFMGVDWLKRPEAAGTSWKYKINDMVATP
jgi:hypothetical protein